MPEKAEKTKFLIVTGKLANKVERLAKAEDRKFAPMVRVLLREALDLRKVAQEAAEEVAAEAVAGLSG